MARTSEALNHREIAMADQLTANRFAVFRLITRAEVEQ